MYVSQTIKLSWIEDKNGKLCKYIHSDKESEETRISYDRMFPDVAPHRENKNYTPSEITDADRDKYWKDYYTP